ncbi:possible ABC transporter, ATP-binding component [Prochlorococcus marinus str. MIT 9515]|uniref:Possible ABC transporter, ATP-binding component n=1 Tax=Prochlorococcus marinus (strain MIT 9515) TaxID=167542 RepID=A2BU87_PROM5|nr:ABC transporter ATP-binding protein [Prochlorococcus marinus]ABM71348.1 possible ABC transporter, ATP-binding component [Prochlorococcus marinus str. MIT 9515]
MSELQDTFKNKVPKITFQNVSFSWPGKKEHIINNCSFSINKTGLWMIVGKNGSGKSTLLKLINGLLKPSNGVINNLANVGMVFQNPDHQILMPNCRSELLLNISKKLSRTDITKKIDFALNTVGLPGFEKRPIHTLSGGQKQRLTIACSLISDKNFVLLDEPTSLLDSSSQLKVLEIIKDLTNNKRNPFTALWITHRLEELSYSDAVAEMKNGNLSDWQKPLNFQYN